MKYLKPFTIERGNPLLEDNRVLHSCLTRSNQKCFLDCDDLARKGLLLQQYGERIDKLSQQDKLSKFCMDAGFLNVVEIRTVFYDGRHFIILIIPCSGLS